ncbi:hypothetical protein [Streptomyces sp. NBC_01716]|uniref:hypothetical protein n=1 Tax=Streptomyces sp. NBC_01716 TaxID=2975917 RepID=UPI002E348FAC|nr:hypothetical protein [Streptomyces sp. NBC_01716]
MDNTRMRAEDIQAYERFNIRQRMSLTTNRYVVTVARPDGSDGEVVAFAEQKRISLKEQMTIYTDESRKSVLSTFEASQVLDIGAEYEVRSGTGQIIGSFRQDPLASVARTTWNVRQPGTMDLTGQERNRVVGVVRRIWGLLPFTDFVPFLWPYHFDFTESGKRLMAVDKKFGLRDRYVLDILAPDIDRRLAITQAVALDALESR